MGLPDRVVVNHRTVTVQHLDGHIGESSRFPRVVENDIVPDHTARVPGIAQPKSNAAVAVYDQIVLDDGSLGPGPEMNRMFRQRAGGADDVSKNITPDNPILG